MIGVDFESPVVVRSIGLVEIEENDKIMFFNSGVRQLSDCLWVYERLLIEAGENERLVVPEKSVEELIDAARNKMQKLDPAAFGGYKNSGWPAILEDSEVMW